MERKFWKQRVQFALPGAIVFCIPAVFYIRDAAYRQTWLLFLGVFFFLIVATITTLIDSRKRKQNVKAVRLMFDSQLTTIISIIITCILCFILLAILIPGYIGSGHAAKVLTGNPPSDVLDKTNGLSLKIFITAIVGNFTAGSFVAILVPFYSSRIGGKTSPETTPLKQ
jgi:hypothetical protein